MLSRFWALTIASGISKLGNQLLYIAVPWVVLNDTHSPALAILSLAAQTVPYIISPILGGIVDRYERRRVFALSEIVQAASVASLPVLLMANHVGIAFVILGVSGLGAVVSGLTSDYGLIPSTVTVDHLGWANSTYSTVVQIGRLLGPAVAGILIRLVGSSWTIWLDAASFLITAGVAFILPSTRRVITRGGLQFYREGFSQFRRAKSMQILTLALALYNLGAGSIAGILLTVGVSRWQWSVSTIGFTLSVGAAMGSVGSWLAGHTFLRRSRVWQLALWLGVCTVGGLFMVIPIAPILILGGYVVLLTGEGAMNVVSMTYRQEGIPTAFAGRVNAIIRMFVLGAIPVSSLIGGYVVGMGGERLPFLPAALGSLSAFYVWRWWTTSSQTSDPQHPAPRTEPAATS